MYVCTTGQVSRPELDSLVNFAVDVTSEKRESLLFYYPLLYDKDNKILYLHFIVGYVVLWKRSGPVAFVRSSKSNRARKPNWAL